LNDDDDDVVAVAMNPTRRTTNDAM